MTTEVAQSEFYSFKALSISGVEVPMSDYQGKVILIVNTASNCGFTPQYEGLQKLYESYKDQGFVVLGFPCNQFGGQEPGSEQEIENGCVLDYALEFPMFSKVKVNGKEAHPLFDYLKKEMPGMLGGRIKWNFTKFLIDRNGNPVKRFASRDKPQAIASEIERLLSR